MSLGGEVLPSSLYYNLSALVRPPVVTAVSPLVGPGAGGHALLVNGSGFAGAAVVELVESIAPHARTACVWVDLPDMFCTDTAIRCVDE